MKSETIAVRDVLKDVIASAWGNFLLADGLFVRLPVDMNKETVDTFSMVPALKLDRRRRELVYHELVMLAFDKNARTDNLDAVVAEYKRRFA